MKYFVLVYDQSEGRLLDVENYGIDGASAALARRFELDHVYADNPNIEVALLSADSEPALVRTHGRYFKSVNELVNAS